MLAVLLLVQLAVLAFIYRPGTQHEPVKKAFFSDIAIEEIQGLTITDDEGKSIALQLNKGKWQIGQGAYPASTESIQDLLGKIIALQSARLVTTTQSSQVRLKVADDLFNRKIELQLADGKSKSFFLGTSPSNKTIHFRLAGQNQVFMVNDLASWEVQTDKESWWEKEYVSIPTEEIETLSITNAKGTFAFQKGDDKKWLIAAKNSELEESQEKIKTFIHSISKLSIDTYLAEKPPGDLGTPLCTVAYTIKSTPLSLTIWPANEENGSHTAKVSNSDFYATIRNYMLKELLEAESGNYLTEPKAPIVEAPQENQQELPLPNSN